MVVNSSITILVTNSSDFHEITLNLNIKHVKIETLKNIDLKICDHSSIAEAQIQNLTFCKKLYKLRFNQAWQALPSLGQSDRSKVSSIL